MRQIFAHMLRKVRIKHNFAQFSNNCLKLDHFPHRIHLLDEIAVRSV